MTGPLSANGMLFGFIARNLAILGFIIFPLCLYVLQNLLLATSNL
mgnify:CR=1 FL=1